MTVSLKKLSSEEIDLAFADKKNGVDLTEHVEALRALRDGDAAEVTLDPQSRRKEVRRFNKAAEQLNVKLKWTHKDGHAYIRVRGSAGDTADESQEAA